MVSLRINSGSHRRWSLAILTLTDNLAAEAVMVRELQVRFFVEPYKRSRPDPGDPKGLK